METIFENERITVDYNNYDEIYRISFFDANFHYIDEMNIDKEQYDALKEFFNKNNKLK